MRSSSTKKSVCVDNYYNICSREIVQFYDHSSSHNSRLILDSVVSYASMESDPHNDVVKHAFAAYKGVWNECADRIGVYLNMLLEIKSLDLPPPLSTSFTTT